MDTLREIFKVGIVNKLFGAQYISEETGVILYNIPWLYAIPAFILLLLVGYLFGSFNFATFISKRKYNDDIREHGSGNAGMTNMMRTYGTKAAALTLIGDILKAVLACLLGYIVLGKAGAYVAGLGSIIGHTWPLYYNFKGGKGVATALAVILCTNPVVALLLLCIFVAIVAATKFISLGSIMCALVYPIILAKFGTLNIVELICCFSLVFLLVFNHRSNIKRLLNNEENKFSFKKSK
ncbi:MAG: glycerol-3-phosphate 1-O-acyltransferase PlsY [Clostridia bacterium]|nr:glycerol-3-phosphate 1-O-acyltransferase PlsY [Clostridia bacterium]